LVSLEDASIVFFDIAKRITAISYILVPIIAFLIRATKTVSTIIDNFDAPEYLENDTCFPLDCSLIYT
jgi:hypothetical protein